MVLRVVYRSLESCARVWRVAEFWVPRNSLPLESVLCVCQLPVTCFLRSFVSGRSGAHFSESTVCWVHALDLSPWS